VASVLIAASTATPSPVAPNSTVSINSGRNGAAPSPADRPAPPSAARPAHVQRIGQEHARVPNRDHLEGKAQTRVITTSLADQPPILIVQMEEPLQLHTRQRPEPAVALHALADHRDMIADLPTPAPHEATTATFRGLVPHGPTGRGPPGGGAGPGRPADSRLGPPPGRPGGTADSERCPALAPSGRAIGRSSILISPAAGPAARGGVSA
jgi:hypothetical protein